MLAPAKLHHGGLGVGLEALLGALIEHALDAPRDHPAVKAELGWHANSPLRPGDAIRSPLKDWFAASLPFLAAVSYASLAGKVHPVYGSPRHLGHFPIVCCHSKRMGWL